MHSIAPYLCPTMSFSNGKDLMSRKNQTDIEDYPVNGYGSKLEDEDDTPATISEKALSWQQTAWLLLLEYVVLAILSFPSSYAILGMAGGLIATVIIGLVTLYTSRVLWIYCMRFPYTRDICDVASKSVLTILFYL